MKPETPAHQPKMLQRIQLRYALGLFAIAALLFAWFYAKRFFENNGDVGHTDTTGWIVALKENGDGEQVVAIKPDGTIQESPGYVTGEADRDPTFNASGERIFFVTGDRDPSSKSLQIYRWNAGRDRIDQRTSGKLAEEHPTYDVQTSGESAPSDLLVIKAGVVVDLDPTKEGVAHQIVPIETKTPTQTGGDENGIGAQFGPEYEHLGTSFREAHWCKNRRFVVGVMRGEDGETLVAICVQPNPSGGPFEDGLPHGVVKGAHVDMAVDPTTGNVAYTVTDFRFVDPSQIPPSMIKNGKVELKLHNMLGFFNPDDPKKAGPILAMADQTKEFEQPAISPDGSSVAVILGTDSGDGFRSAGLIVTPFATGSANKARMLIPGDIAQPSWSPDGKNIVVVSTGADNHSDIVLVPVNGDPPRPLTAGQGSFSAPQCSPMLSKAGS